MGDPRNVAHDKKVSQEKEHEQAKTAPSKRKSKKAAAAESTESKKSEPAKPDDAVVPDTRKLEPGDHEKSLAILSKVKEMEFYSRSNIEKLAELSLAIEEELKQKTFAEPIGALYSAQAAFQTQVSAFIESYEAECERLKPKE